MMIVDVLNNDEHWTDYAICRGADPDLFFPIGYAGYPLEEQETAAKEICANCPVRAECLGWALRAGEPDGIWGGTNPEERRHLRRRRTAAAPPPPEQRARAPRGCAVRSCP